MNLLQQFLEYAQAFEETYKDDDWERLERFFAPDAVYRVVGSPDVDCEIHGRRELLSGMRKFVNEFDRHCTRTLRPAGAPKVGKNTVRVSGIAAYTIGDSEELPLRIELLAQYDDQGRIIRLSDIYPAETADVFASWLARWAPHLHPSYV